MTVEGAPRPRVEMHLDIPEGTPSSPFLEIWKLADEGAIVTDQFIVRFEREVGEESNPQIVYVNVYDSSGVETLATYYIDEGGLFDFPKPRMVTKGLPWFDFSPSETPTDVTRTKMRQDAYTVLDFLREQKQATSGQLSYQI